MTCPGVPPGALTLEYLTISPNPFIAGQNASIHAVGNSTANITSGANVTLTLNIAGIFPIYERSIDLCQTLQEFEGVSCPITAGQQNISISNELPAGTPAAEYLVKVNAVNGDGSNLICVEGPITVQSGGGGGSGGGSAATTSSPTPATSPGAPIPTTTTG
ncbi:Phosphatidylglycerol/phosphatidylinositol transfer protein [Geranomyces michiganensis]|nr:Phosphatidylglycerol/phosphatidylinositol transfer protein [Geranomyces michiganensis]